MGQLNIFAAGLILVILLIYTFFKMLSEFIAYMNVGESFFYYAIAIGASVVLIKTRNKK